MTKILITGGTGSFGGTMVRSLLKDKKISEIIVFSRDEKKQHDMRHEISSSKLRFVVGDVRDKDAIFDALHGVDYVFHAAALKQVPTGEFFPMELVKTNILGTQNVLDSAEAQGVKKVICLSTDKAVYPINAMGMTKAMVEKLMVAKSRRNRGTIFCAVRYGNVMASRGSVIPLFVDKMRRGEDLTITVAEMTRFMLSLTDAIDLVHFALKHGEQGDIFIKKAPAATVETLTEALLSIFNSKSKMKSVGIREGEKIHETLAHQMELAHAEDMGDYFRVINRPGFDYESFYSKGKKPNIKGDYTSDAAKRLSRKEMEKMLLSLDYIKEELAK
jgi:UDP-glucose 4-epimerase